MTRCHPCRSGVLLLLLLVACLGSNPPGPPVRWFDPWSGPSAPTTAAVAGAGAELPGLVVTAASLLGQAFVVRVGEHELAIDDGLRWAASPEQLVGDALRRQLAPTQVGNRLDVVVRRFEVAASPAPQAAVELVYARADGRRGAVSAVGMASSGEPAALAAAMAEALTQAAGQLGRELPRD